MPISLAQNVDAKPHAVPFERATFVPAHPRKRFSALWAILIIWFVAIVVVFLANYPINQSNPLQEVMDDQSLLAKQPIPPALSQEEQFLDKALPQCAAVLEGFLSAETVDVQLPLVLADEGIALRMKRHQAENARLIVDPLTIVQTASTLLYLPEGKTVLTHWETPDGASFDAAFRQHDGKWRLDWDHFVRYSDLSWALFLAGFGENDEAEFRLHARRRVASGSDPRNSIGVVLSAPLRRHLKEGGYGRPVEGIPLSQADGKLLRMAFDREKAGIPIFGGKFPNINPQDRIRVRVRVRRIVDEEGLSFRITQVLACHWLTSKASGMKSLDQG